MATGRGIGPFLIAAAVLAAGPALAAGAQTNDSWAAIARLPQITGIYELARIPNGPKDGRRDVHPVFTPAAMAAAKAKAAAQDNPTANCLPPGMPQIMDQPYPIQVLVTPGEVTIIQEAYMQVRHVHTDGRAHPADPDLTFNGDSIGHWEGDTLVVDTVGLAPESAFSDGVQHSPKEHIVERIRLAEPDLLEIRAMIEDPGVLAQPWSYVGRYRRHADWSLAEYICEQNNRNSVDANGKAAINLDLKK